LFHNTAESAGRKIVSWTTGHRDQSALRAVSILVMAAARPNPVPTIVLNPPHDLPDFHAGTLPKITDCGKSRPRANVQLSGAAFRIRSNCPVRNIVSFSTNPLASSAVKNSGFWALPRITNHHMVFLVIVLDVPAILDKPCAQ
jgi:hypothetical protein